MSEADFTSNYDRYQPEFYEDTFIKKKGKKKSKKVKNFI